MGNEEIWKSRDFFEQLISWLKDAYPNPGFAAMFFQLLQQRPEPGKNEHFDGLDEKFQNLLEDNTLSCTPLGCAIDIIKENYFSWFERHQEYSPVLPNLNEKIIFTLIDGIINHLPLSQGISFLETHYDNYFAKNDSVVLFFFHYVNQLESPYSNRLKEKLAELIEYICRLPDNELIAFLEEGTEEDHRILDGDEGSPFWCLYIGLNKITPRLLQCTPDALESFLCSEYYRDKTYYENILELALESTTKIEDFEQLLFRVSRTERPVFDDQEPQYKLYIEKILPILEVVYPVSGDAQSSEAAFEGALDTLKSFSPEELNQLIKIKKNFIDFVLSKLQNTMEPENFGELIRELACIHETNPDILTWRVEQIIHLLINDSITTKQESFFKIAFDSLKEVYPSEISKT
ncbi:hypothetical protein [Coxiella burnetii]|uniref:hypothetical protein n=1 Tax=Coxiella burnetii TaxID=777 RepID=UPI0022316DA0|nr:hypothetical protein [Coxiella burnetii]